MQIARRSRITCSANTIFAGYDNTRNDIVEGTQYVFYASLGENSGTPVRCSLRYFEMVE